MFAHRRGDVLHCVLELLDCFASLAMTHPHYSLLTKWELARIPEKLMELSMGVRSNMLN